MSTDEPDSGGESLGRLLGLCAVPLGLFAVAIGVVLTLGPSMVGGIAAVAIGGDLLLTGVWMLVTGRPRMLPFTAARLRSTPGTEGSALPDLR